MKDILLENDDLAFKNGDLDVGTSDLQQQRLLLLSNKGSWRQHPLTGVGINDYLNDDHKEELFLEIRKQFKADGINIKAIAFEKDGKINIEATYDD